MDQEHTIPKNEGALENATSASEQQPQTIEINYGRITYLSEEKGAFVELITGADQNALRAESLESVQKLEIFVPGS